MDKIIFTLLIVVLMPASAHAKDVANAPLSEREIYTCVDEAKRLGSWSRLAERLDLEKSGKKFPDVKLVEIKAGDGVTLRGVTNRQGSPGKNAVLVIGGNGWSAKPFVEYVLPHFKPYDADVYYLDFRGYGISTPANTTMHAIIEDYRDISAWLLNQGYEHLYLYGFSFGGVVALASFPQLSPFERIVIDASPSRASDFGFECSPPLETVDFVPAHCANLTIMHGTSDWVMPRPKVKELIDTARACGATIDVDVKRGHPFQIEWESSRIKRVAAVMKHFGIGEKP